MAEINYTITDIPHTKRKLFFRMESNKRQRVPKAIKNGQSRETDNIENNRKKRTKTQHIMYWTPLQAKKHKQCK
jgi:hypothetical protein